MKHSATIAGRDWSFAAPMTTREVLHYRVFIRAHANDVTRYLGELVDWLSVYVDDFDLDAFSGETALRDLIGLAEAVVAAAGLPADVLAGLETFWRRSLDLEGFTPDPACDCPSCAHGEELADASLCQLHGVSDASLVVGSALTGLDAPGLLGEPWWVYQVFNAKGRLKSAMMGKREQDRRRSEETESAVRAVAPNLPRLPSAWRH